MQTEHQSIAEPLTHLARRPPEDHGLQWGSDPSFQYHGFSCPIGSWTEERMVRNMMRNVTFMCRSFDIELNTNPGIPLFTYNSASGEWSFLERLDGPSQLDVPASETEVPSLSPDLDSNTKSTTPESASTSSICSSQRIKPSTTPSRKRKCVQKPGQSLCHCQTEKRRRENISQWYDRLSQVVPALRGQSFTRKYVLEGAANYVEHLIDGNQALQQQLDEIKAKEAT
ncbi:hypothetical protein N7492_008097 [Penicillium capsulatum]|uniref:BHLH domain-containing protein n=1 Tax=Penicillium capsulatum TaxID=69766 RepID=A0A9W9LGE1_9EURO|nr:hypothetical protein N7492_008097 [Penicillium capsulatum]KAJ6105507.1 hypothetical protein N7512_009024 [Penicillium capsulatum]